MTVMFPPKGSLAHNQSEFGIGTGTTETVSHLFDGLLSGPYEPDATTAETRAMVPQLLSNSDGDDAWYYRPDSPIPLPNSEPFDLTLISSGTTTTTSYNEISKSVLPPSIKSIDTTRTLAPFPASSPTIDTSLTSSALISTGCDRLGLRLLSPLSHGRLWTVYRALLIPAHPLSSPESDRTEGSPLPVMVKLCLPLLFPCRPCADSYSEFTARSAILNEHSVFAHMPKRLLGKLVPTYYGLWGGVFTMEDRWSSSASESGRMMTGAIARREVWLMVLEDCGEGGGDGGQGLTGDER